METNSKLKKVRHSLAHLLAAAVLEENPDAKLAIGPTIKNGFYYDFELSKPFGEENLEKLEKKIKRYIKQNIEFKHFELSEKEARNKFKKEPYKLELIDELTKKGEKLSFYQSGDFIDLCGGPHVKSTSEINPNSFKLTKISGAYWRGDEKNKMLTRIYGIAFENKEKLDEYLKMQEEAEKRDHRVLGKELDLFSFHKEGPGFPFWHPKGTIIYNELKNFIREENEKRGYGEVMTPIMLSKNLWITSGHWDKFRDDMYFSKIDDEEIAIKPMNCPGSVLIYKEKMRSYRDLPLRYSEFGLVHRHELSGVLHGLLRARSFTQDDAHSYCTEEQLNGEIINMVDYALDIYKAFGFDDYEIFIATKPEKHIGEDSVWELATNSLIQALKEKELEYKTKDGEGAFYGPKIEFDIKDAIGRNWQMGTIQVDLSMPKRFDAVYIDKESNKKTPVMVHRAILGSFERFIGVLIEHFAGALPLWLSPVQVKVLPISDTHKDYAKEVFEKLKENNIRVELDDSNETLGKKIRQGKLEKIPYLLVLGDKEIEGKKVTIENREKRNEGATSIEEFIIKLKNEIIKKSR